MSSLSEMSDKILIKKPNYSQIIQFFLNINVPIKYINIDKNIHLNKIRR